VSKKRKTTALPMALPVLQLAEAHTRLVHGCARTATAPSLQLGGRPVPWILGFGAPKKPAPEDATPEDATPEDTAPDRRPRVIIAEPWAGLKAIHRRKNGFSHLNSRFEALAQLANTQFEGATLEFEIWEDSPSEPLDQSLLDKLEPRLPGPLSRFPAARFPEALTAVENALTADMVSDANPLLAVLAWTHAIREPAAP